MLTLHFNVKLLESSFLCLIINLEFILNIPCGSNLFFSSCIAIWLLLHNLLKSLSSTVFSFNILLWKFSNIQKSWENFIVSTDIPNLRFYPVCWTCADGAKEIGIQLWSQIQYVKPDLFIYFQKHIWESSCFTLSQTFKRFPHSHPQRKNGHSQFSGKLIFIKISLREGTWVNLWLTHVDVW